MIDKVKYLLKLSSIAFITFFKLYLLGSINMVASFIPGMVYLLKSMPESNGLAHANGSGALFLVIAMRPVQCALLALIVVSLYFLFAAISRYVVKKIINRIVLDKSESTILPLIDKVILKVKGGQPAVIKSSADFALVKLQLVQKVRDESENKWVKKALIYGLKKLTINDVDLNREGMDTFDLIRLKTMAGLQNVTAPDKKAIWIILALQWLCALIVIFTA